MRKSSLHAQQHPGGFTVACTTLSASSETVAFQAEETVWLDSQGAFCSIQRLQNLLFTEMSRTQVQLVFLKGGRCHTEELRVNTVE